MHPMVRKVFEDGQRRETFSPLPYVQLMRRRPVTGTGPLLPDAASGAEPPVSGRSAAQLLRFMRSR